ncbi:MAG: HAD family hydrolase [Ruminococcaceae bacterium]|nr:HAD family hydrolase [Oscillospiraceae bacterium]
MKYTHILWDFNGTIIDDVATGIKSVNTLLERRGLPTVDTLERYHEVFTFPITKYYINLGFDFEKEPFSEIAIEWTEQNEENIKKAPLHDGVREALEFFKEKNIPQIILSATKRDMLINHIKGLCVYEYFDEFLGLDNIHAESKVEIGIEWMKNNKGAVPLMIGDTTHDSEVAEKMGCECILIAKGHQSVQTLMATGRKIYISLDEAIKDIFDK